MLTTDGNSPVPVSATQVAISLSIVVVLYTVLAGSSRPFLMVRYARRAPDEPSTTSAVDAPDDPCRHRAARRRSLTY